MPFLLVGDDITKIKVDAIVNTANTALHMDSVCDSIFYTAGIEKLQAACAKMGPVEVGEAGITPAFNLPARFIIHTATPVFRDGKRGEARLLRACYVNSLELAVRNKCKSIAFPLLSTGIYGFPQKSVFLIATGAIRDFLTTHEIDVRLIVRDKASLPIETPLLDAVESFLKKRDKDRGAQDQYLIDKRYENQGDQVQHLTDKRDKDKDVPPEIVPVYVTLYQRVEKPPSREEVESRILELETAFAEKPSDELAQRLDYARSLLDIVIKLDEPFSQTLLRLIDAKGKSDVDVYKRANIDRRLFSKIRSGKGYTPRKRTILALAIALELTRSETDELLKRAGYAFSPSQLADVIVGHYIDNKKYNIIEINEALFHYDQQLLGG